MVTICKGRSKKEVEQGKAIRIIELHDTLVIRNKKNQMEQLNEQIERLKEKLNRLRSLDPKFEIFGSEKHQYQLNDPKSEGEILEFERTHSVKLPAEYRAFLKSVGNGGAGPYYGLEPLENGLYDDLDYKNPDSLMDISQAFPHTEPWNVDFENLSEEEYQEAEDAYFENKWSRGMLRISNFGCGVSMNLIVNGKEYGNIWVDDRCNDMGIYPDSYFGQKSRTTFLDWYELWLDRSLNEKT